MTSLKIQIIGPDDTDTDERVTHMRSLMRLLNDAPDVEAVEARGADAPSGAKGAGLDIASLVVSASGGIPGLLAMIDAWRERRHAGNVRIEMDGHVLELRDCSPDERRVVIRAWLKQIAED